MTSFTLTTQEHYANSFKIFREKTRELPKITETLKLHLQTIMPKLKQPTSQRHQFNVLSIGSGSGEIDMEIVKIIKEDIQKYGDCQHMKIYNRAIEPNGYLLSLYEAAIRRLPRQFLGGGGGEEEEEEVVGGVAFELSKMTFEEFKEKIGNDDKVKFDIIHFVHSIYYVDIEKSLVHCFEKILYKNGLVICVIVGEGCFSDTVITKIKKYWHDQREISKKKATADGIIKIAEKHKWKCEVYTQKSDIDVSEIFDEHSKDGNLLLDFLTHKVNFRFATDKTLVQETLDLIREETFVENGKQFGKRTDHFLFIYK